MVKDILFYIACFFAMAGWFYALGLRQEIKYVWRRSARPPRAKETVDGVFAVPDTEPWWTAVHDTINEAEWETIEESRRFTPNTNQCLSSVGAGEGIALVRQKLLDKRRLALTVQPGAIKNAS